MTCVNSRLTRAKLRQQILADAEPEWLKRHPRRGYVRQVALAALPWIDRKEFHWLEWCRIGWSRVTGVEHVLDHIVPLNHSHVCGLSVPWNFALVPRAVNAYKGGRWDPDQHQLQLTEA